MKIINRSLKYLLLSLLAFFLLSPLHVIAEEGESVELNYVALGDSLAAGFLNKTDPPLYEIGNGYPFFIKQGIEAEMGYGINLTNRGIGGYTTEDVRIQVEYDLVVQAQIESADFITLDAGANDLLGAVDIGAIDMSDPESMEAALQDAMAALSQVEENMDVILNKITELNPDAPIYVMGYYNALPYLEDMQEIVVMIIGMLNDTIYDVTSNYEASYVPTFAAYEGNYELYLPNLNNIHQTEEGYEVIADLFLEQIIPNLEPVEDPDIEAPVITLIGDNPLEIEVGELYEEQGATAEDNRDGDVTDHIDITGDVNTAENGEYIVTYTVVDEAGNEATITRTVHVIEVDLPDPEPGEDGEDGEDGKDGTDGKDGADGTDGKAGADGTDGKAGADGTDGKAGADGTDGKAGADGTDGKAGADGTDGKAGAGGQDHQNGVTGEVAGAEGAIKSVKSGNGEHVQTIQGQKEVLASDAGSRSDQGGQLPHTATNIYLLLVIGTLLFGTGVFIKRITRRELTRTKTL